jgi:pimeloyl-ACP methyl ester carboxylesterase
VSREARSIGDSMDWSFDGAWPYEPRWFDSEDGGMHYADEGPRDGRPVIMVHGNPTWAFSIATSSRRWSTRDSVRLRFAHRPRGKVELPLPLRLFRTPVVGEVMVKRLDLFKRGFLFRKGVVHRERLTAEVRRAYRAPHPSWSSRTPILVFPREIPSGPEGPVSDLVAEIEAGLERDFRSKPVDIAWAMKDIAFSPQVLERAWLQTFPHAEVTRIEDAGHYLQEDAHGKIIPALLEHLSA